MTHSIDMSCDASNCENSCFALDRSLSCSYILFFIPIFDFSFCRKSTILRQFWFFLSRFSSLHLNWLRSRDKERRAFEKSISHREIEGCWIDRRCLAPIVTASESRRRVAPARKDPLRDWTSWALTLVPFLPGWSVEDDRCQAGSQERGRRQLWDG